jgi:hypothetical protein
VALLTSNAPANLASDWNLGCIRIVARRATPGLRLLTADGVEIAAWRGFVPPKELGFTLRRHFGVPNPFRTTATGTAPRGCR